MHRQNLYLAILFVLVFTFGAFADVKVKSRQTVSGQSFENTTYIKGKRQRTEQDMGGIKMINLTQCDLKRGVQINEQTKSYIVNSFGQSESASRNPQAGNQNDGVVRAGGTVTSTVTSKDTGETRKMFGYNARHIITTIETVSSPDACVVSNSKMELDGWYIDAEFALDCETEKYAGGYNTSGKQGCQDKYQTKTIGNAKRGFAVYEKMTMFDASGKELTSTVSEVLEFSKATLDNALFEIPSDYREVSDTNALYMASSSSMNSNSMSSSMSSDNYGNAPSGTVQNIVNQSQTASSSNINTEAKKSGVTRIGITVKTGSVGEGLNAGDLAAAVQNTLGEYLKGTNIELVPLEAKLASAIGNEAAQKECDFILYLNASHKKGKSGGGFGGMFGKVIAPAISQTGIGGTGSQIGNVAGQIATQTIISASTMSDNVKSKDEITLSVKVQKLNASDVLNKEYKAKAKSDGEDILSPLIEQIAEAILASAK